MVMATEEAREVEVVMAMDGGDGVVSVVSDGKW